MSLRALRTLVAISKHGTFAAAGDILGLTQSAISLQIKNLEEEFSVILFDRSHRRPILTEAGHILVKHAIDILAAYENITVELAGESNISGRFRLGAVQTVLSGWLPDALANLKQTHPLLRINIISGLSGDLAQQIERGELDGAITTEPVKPYPMGLHFTPLTIDRFWIIAPSSAKGMSARELLTELPFLRFDKHSWAGRMIDEELKRQKIRVQEEMALDNQEALVRMTKNGLGVTIIPCATEHLTELLPLIYLPFGEPQRQRKIGFLESEKHPKKTLSETIISSIRKNQTMSFSH